VDETTSVPEADPAVEVRELPARSEEEAPSVAVKEAGDNVHDSSEVKNNKDEWVESRVSEIVGVAKKRRPEANEKDAAVTKSFPVRLAEFLKGIVANSSKALVVTASEVKVKELDGFEKRRLPSPGLQVEVVILDHDTPIPRKKAAEGTGSQSAGGATEASTGSALVLEKAEKGWWSRLLKAEGDQAEASEADSATTGANPGACTRLFR
jgi:hypothetical protein